jgi:hypothetical protein
LLNKHHHFRNDNETGCVAQDEVGSSAAMYFAFFTLMILILPTMWLSLMFLLDTRKMLKKVDKFNFWMKVLFWVGLFTCTGYLIKELDFSWKLNKSKNGEDYSSCNTA